MHVPEKRTDDACEFGRIARSTPGLDRFGVRRRHRGLRGSDDLEPQQPAVAQLRWLGEADLVELARERRVDVIAGNLEHLAFARTAAQLLGRADAVRLLELSGDTDAQEL